MAKFNVGDKVYFHKGNGPMNFVSYYIDEIVGDTAYMEDDTDIPLSKLLTEDEYNSARQEYFKSKAIPVSNTRTIDDVIREFPVNKEDNFNRKIINKIAVLFPELIEYAAYCIVCANGRSPDTINYSKLYDAFMGDHFTPFEKVDLFSRVTTVPVSIFQQFWKNDDYLRMAILKGMLNISEGLVLFKANRFINNATIPV